MQSAFIGGGDQEPSLDPIDSLDFVFKESLPEKDYGGWAKKQVHLNDNLELEEDQAVRDFAESAVK